MQQEAERNLTTPEHLCKLYAVILEQSLNRLKVGRSKAEETSLAVPGQGKMAKKKEEKQMPKGEGEPQKNREMTLDIEAEPQVLPEITVDVEAEPQLPREITVDVESVPVPRLKGKKRK